MRVVLVHGRAQQGKDPIRLQKTWEDTLAKGLQMAGVALPAGTTVSFPFYGDELDRLIKELEAPLIEDVATKGAAIDNGEVVFRAMLASELADNADLTTADIEKELPPSVKEKGPLQWEWVHAILKALDKNKKIGKFVVDQFTRDAYVYLTNPAVANKIHDIVRPAIDGAGPCVVVGHSLGSIVSYRLLSELSGKVDVRAFITVGSPLGLNAIRNTLTRPLAMPKKVARWRNAYDDRDVVALLPLDSKNWPITPAIENFGDVHNQTDNAHGIEGYLNDKQVALWVAEGLT